MREGQTRTTRTTKPTKPTRTTRTTRKQNQQELHNQQNNNRKTQNNRTNNITKTTNTTEPPKPSNTTQQNQQNIPQCPGRRPLRRHNVRPCQRKQPFRRQQRQRLVPAHFRDRRDGMRPHHLAMAMVQWYSGAMENGAMENEYEKYDQGKNYQEIICLFLSLATKLLSHHKHNEPEYPKKK